MSNQQAIDEALDQLEIDNEVVEEVIEEVEQVEVVQEIEEVEEKPENPPGYIDNLDDWVAAGKDPDLFKGKKAYEAEYERIKEIKDLRETMQTVTEGIGEWKQNQEQETERRIEQAKANALEELERAREDVDVDAAIKAQKKIDELEKPKQQEYKPNPVLTNFYSKNPILDKNSAQYDDEVFKDASMYQAAILDELTGGNRQMQLTESQISRSLKVALTKAKALSPDKFVSPRNARKAAPAPARKNINKNNGDYASKLKSVKSNSRNKHDTSAANDIYEMLKAKDPKAAETFAKNVLGE